MPTTVEHFTLGSVTIPPRIYLDTSFLLRCYFAQFTPKGLTLVEQKKNSECNSFLSKLYGSAIHVSLLTVEESIHRIYFKGHIRRMAKAHGLEHRWKEYKNKFPADFRNARGQGIQELKRFVTFLDKLPIRFIDANTFFQKKRHLLLVAKYARLVLEKYDTVEPMDTFHFALMRVNRIDCYVTAEEHLGSGFDEFSVLTL